MKTCLLLVLGIALTPVGYAQTVKVSVVAVESVDDFKRWLGSPVDAARAASPAAYPGRLTQLPFGRKTQLPIVVTGLSSPALQATQLVADVEVLGTDGRSLGTSPKCCQATIAKGSNERAVLLTSTVNVEPEAGRKGSYTVRVSVTDGAQTWTTSEVLRYGESEGPGYLNEAPRLNMNVPPPAKAEPGKPGDKRDCLGLPTPAEVIKCSERK